MAAIAREWLLFASFSGLFLSIFYFDKDFGQLLRYGVYCLIGLGIFTLVLHYIRELLKSIQKTVNNSVATDADRLIYVQDKQEQAREKVQENHSVKASDFNERILKPREDAKRVEKEKTFYNFMGGVWRGKGDKLGIANTESNDMPKCKKDGSSKDAASVRRLPDHIENPPPPPPQPKPKVIRRIVLPEEPEPGTEGSVHIAIRTPLGKVHKRRFMCSDKIQLVLDFMGTTGFPERVYMLSTSYPRHCISQDPHTTLEDMGLTTDMALNVEEKD